MRTKPIHQSTYTIDLSDRGDTKVDLGKIDLSIVIPHYRSVQTCLSAIASVESDHYVVEIIVIDDASPPSDYDALKDAVVRYVNEKRSSTKQRLLTLIRQQNNRGAYQCRLLAAREARGRYLKFLDHDDTLIKGALDQEIVLAKSTDADIVLTNWLESWGEFNGARFVEQHQTTRLAPTYNEATLDFLRYGGVYTSAALYKSALFDRVEAVTQWQPVYSDDWLIFAQAMLQARNIKTLDQPSYRWRHHQGQRSKDTPLAHAEEFYHFLLWYLEQLKVRNLLSGEHRHTMAEYLTKNAVLLCWQDSKRWFDVAAIIKSLDKSRRRSPYWGTILNGLACVFGLKNSVFIYVIVKRLLTPNALRDSVQHPHQAKSVKHVNRGL